MLVKESKALRPGVGGEGSRRVTLKHKDRSRGQPADKTPLKYHAQPPICMCQSKMTVSKLIPTQIIQNIMNYGLGCLYFGLCMW